MIAAARDEFGSRHRSGGFTLVEAVMSMLLVSVLLVAAARATSGSGLVQFKAAQRATARLLADGLMNEIVALPYEDPNVTPLFGVEAGESTSNRSNYDDVDDYNGYSESPPKDHDGSTISNMTGWKRSVIVQRVNVLDPTTTSASETGLRRITVNVYFNNALVVTRVALRSKAP